MTEDARGQVMRKNMKNIFFRILKINEEKRWIRSWIQIRTKMSWIPNTADNTRKRQENSCTFTGIRGYERTGQLFVLAVQEIVELPVHPFWPRNSGRGRFLQPLTITNSCQAAKQ